MVAMKLRGIVLGDITGDVSDVDYCRCVAPSEALALTRHHSWSTGQFSYDIVQYRSDRS